MRYLKQRFEEIDRVDVVVRAFLSALGVVVVLAGFLPWDYDEFFGEGWEMGVEFSTVWPIMFLGAACARLAWRRRYLLASAAATACALATLAFKTFASSGLFGERARPQDAGAGVYVTLVAALVIVVGGVLAMLASGEDGSRPSRRDGRTGA